MKCACAKQQKWDIKFKKYNKIVDQTAGANNSYLYLADYQLAELEVIQCRQKAGGANA